MMRPPRQLVRTYPQATAGMPNDIAVKMRTWWRRDELDDQLIRRADDPTADPCLARRAAQLQARSTRIDFAFSVPLNPFKLQRSGASAEQQHAGFLENLALRT